MLLLLTIDGEKSRMNRRIRAFEVLLAQSMLHCCRYWLPTFPQTSMVGETASRVAGCDSNMCVLDAEFYSYGYAPAKFALSFFLRGLGVTKWFLIMVTNAYVGRWSSDV